MELPEPVTTTMGMPQNFTNEGGYQRRYRYLRNIMGLWMSQCVRRELNGVDYVEGKTAHQNLSGRGIGFGEMVQTARDAEDFSACVAITQDADGHFKFIVSEGVIEDGPTLQNGDTTFRARFSLGAREWNNRWCECGPTHHFAAAQGSWTDTIQKVAKPFFDEPREWVNMGAQADNLRGAPFLTTGSGKYMRNVEGDPAHNIGIAQINEAGDSYRIVWGLLDGARPTSESPSHFMNHSVGRSHGWLQPGGLPRAHPGQHRHELRGAPDPSGALPIVNMAARSVDIARPGRLCPSRRT